MGSHWEWCSQAVNSTGVHPGIEGLGPSPPPVGPDAAHIPPCITHGVASHPNSTHLLLWAIVATCSTKHMVRLAPGEHLGGGSCHFVIIVAGSLWGVGGPSRQISALGR